MKKFVKRLVLCTAAAGALFTAFSFSGCILDIETGGDEICSFKMYRKATDNGFYVFSIDITETGTNNYYFEDVEIDLRDYSYKSYYSTADSSALDECEVVVSGTTSQEQTLSFAEGYEELASYLTGHTSVVDCLAWKDGDTVYGFCNSYTVSNMLVMVVGNQNRVDKIYDSFLFTYDLASNEVEILYTADKAVSCAYSDGTLIYLKDNNFYACDISTGEESLLMENYAVTQKTGDVTVNNIYFDNEYVYFDLRTTIWSEWVTYRHLYSFGSGEIYLLEDQLRV